MSDSPRLAGRSAVAVLAAAASCALGVATTSTASVLSQDGPELCCETVSTESRTTPIPRPATSRPAGVPMCLVGSWRAIDETLVIAFYNDQPPIRFTSRGREFEFRPDGTMVEEQDDVVMTASYGDVELRIVGNGASEFTWSATDSAVTYAARTKADITYSFYDQRGLINTRRPATDPAMNEVDDYTCSGDTVVESNKNGFRSAWVRTAAFGVYG